MLLPIMPGPSLVSSFFSGTRGLVPLVRISFARKVCDNCLVLPFLLTLVRERWLSWTNVWRYGSNEKQDYVLLGLAPLIVSTWSFLPSMSHSCPVFSDLWHFSNPLITSAQTLTANCLYQLEILLSQETAPSDTAATIVGPVSGEGGYLPVPPEFLQGLRKVCDKQCWLWLEFKVGMGSYFVIEESGVKPDVLVMAKVVFFWSIVIYFMCRVLGTDGRR